MLLLLPLQLIFFIIIANLSFFFIIVIDISMITIFFIVNINYSH